MPIKDGREYRAAMEFSVTDEDYVVEGYATTFDAPYDFGYWGAKECIARTALDGADMSDVIFQLNHQGMVLARQRNNTLTVTPDSHGLHVRANLGGCAQGREIYEGIKNGLLDRMSWGFLVSEDGWEWDADTRTSTITKIDKVFDVSVVDRPANEDTSIQARSYLDGVIEAERQELTRRQQDERELIAIRMRLKGLML